MARVWVIGGLSGIGAAITKEMQEQGYQTLANDQDFGGNVLSMRQLLSSFKGFRPHYIVYCAGINKIMPASVFDEFEALNILDVNALGFMRLMRIVAEDYIEHKPRSIVAISSDAATHPMRNSMAYCASKAALNMAVRCAARELAPHVQINAVAPGSVDDTPMSRQIDEEVRETNGWSEEEARAYELSRIPMRRRATATEIANVVRDVLTAPAYLTGAIIEVNGGR
jgi:NAD(P)-dependent dehydrogenase (short-subunit alcohol dehydrogenase family)